MGRYKDRTKSGHQFHRMAILDENKTVILTQSHTENTKSSVSHEASEFEKEVLLHLFKVLLSGNG